MKNEYQQFWFVANEPLSFYPYFLLCLLLLGSSLLFSCDKEEEPIPAYLYIPEAKLTTNYSQFGTANHDITDVWVFVNEQPIGLYDLPATIPILAEGMTDLALEAGVPEDGGNIRKRYPFWGFYLDSLEFESGVTSSLTPTFEYQNAQMVLNNDFEQGNNFEVLQGNGAFQAVSGNVVFEGARSGYIELVGEGSSFIVGTIDPLFLPQPGNEGIQTYLELNYKNDQPFNVLIAGVENANGIVNPFEEYILTVNPSEEWDKLYISLTNVIAQHQTAASFNLIFEATLRDGNSVGNFYYDNVKVIHNVF